MFIIFKILAVFNIHIGIVCLPDILIIRKDNDVLHPLMTENGVNIKKKQCINHVNIFSAAVQQNWHTLRWQTSAMMNFSLTHLINENL